MSYRLLSAILKSKWFIDPSFMESQLPLVANWLTKGEIPKAYEEDDDDEDDDKPKSFGIVFHQSKQIQVEGSLWEGYDYDQVPEGSITLLNVRGTLLKYGGFCSVGTADIAKRIQEADDHRNIKGIILRFDTPGGTIDGIQEFADTIKNTKKPVVGFVDGLCASAGIYSASSCDYLIANNITAEIGSIGVMMSFVDTKPYYEKLGFKFHEIYSSYSPDKNRDSREAMDGKYDLIIKEGLDPLAKIFHNQIKTNRPAVKEDSMTGKVYLAEEALQRGLIDEIGGIEVAANKVNELAKAQAEASINNKSKTEMKEYPKLQALLGLDGPMESTDEGSYLSEENLQVIEDRLASADTTAAELATANQNLTNTQASLQTAQEQLAERDQTIEAMKEKPAAKPATASINTDSPKSEETSEDIITICEEEDTATAAARLKEMGF